MLPRFARSRSKVAQSYFASLEQPLTNLGEYGAGGCAQSHDSARAEVRFYTPMPVAEDAQSTFSFPSIAGEMTVQLRRFVTSPLPLFQFEFASETRAAPPLVAAAKCLALCIKVSYSCL